MKQKNKIIQEERIGCFLRKDFDFIQNFYLKEIKKLEKNKYLENPRILIQTSKRAFYLQSFIEDMAFFGYPKIKKMMENRFLKDFESKSILKNIQKEAFKKALNKFSGQRQIGENEYIINNNNIYHRSLAGKWFQVSPSEAFYLLPKHERIVDKENSKNLESEYKLNILDEIYRNWQQKEWSATINESLIKIERGSTTPREYFDGSVKQIGDILKTPASLGALIKISGRNEEYLEQLVKISYKIINFISSKKEKSTHYLHLLRDGIMFAEAQKTIDFLSNENSSSSQIMVGRKLLSSREGEEFYWKLVVDVLYSGLKKYPNNFDKFYNEYIKSMKEQEKRHPDLRNFFIRLSDYINENIKIDKDIIKNIIICDTGLQGSVNMLIKYLIDNYIFKNKKINIKTDICMFVVGEWFKGIYKNRYFDDYYPMMKDIEILMRGDQLYHYKKNSFEQGKLQVEMGGEKQQLLANVELFVLVQMCMLMKEGGLI